MKRQIKNSNVRTATQIVGVVVAAIIMLTSNQVSAQERNDSLRRKAQVSFIYPVGSNGQSTSYANDFSFNIIYGMNGGVNGFEFGGVANHNSGDVSGAQIAGVTNITNGSTQGAQISGIANINNGSTQGFQLSTVNVGNGDVQGMQLGVVNYARKMNGVSLGVINVIGEGEKALPIGLINVVKGGYYELEVTGGEALNANINFKMGVERFYTIFKLGYSSYNNKPVYSYGIGFGTLMTFSDKHKMSVDLSTNHIGYDGDWKGWSDEKNFLNKLEISYRRQLNSRLSLIAGPSFNYYISEVKVGESFGTLNNTGNLSSSENDSRKKSSWIGFNAGLAFRL